MYGEGWWAIRLDCVGVLRSQIEELIVTMSMLPCEKWRKALKAKASGSYKTRRRDDIGVAVVAAGRADAAKAAGAASKRKRRDDDVAAHDNTE